MATVHYNVTRYVERLLERHQSSPPSFTVHLYPDHFTLNQPTKPQFLYNGPMAVRMSVQLSRRLLIPHAAATRRHTRSADAHGPS